MLTALGFSGYKPFDRPVSFRVAPLTVLFGRNNAGKSAVLRLPELLWTGLRTDDQAPLRIDRAEANLGWDFVDLLHNKQPHGRLRIEFSLETSQRRISVVAEIQHFAEFRKQAVTFLEISWSGSGNLTLEWQANLFGEPRFDNTGMDLYRAHFTDGSIADVATRFEGILPKHLDLETPDRRDPRNVFIQEALEVLSEIRVSYPHTAYIGPFRQVPMRVYHLGGETPGHVGSEGQFAPIILAHERGRGRSEIAAEVNVSMSSLLPGWQIATDRIDARLFRLELVRLDDPAVRVDLTDAGTGISQALPLFVECALAPRPGDTIQPTLQLVEQPELHLHPGAHGILADLYLEYIGHGGQAIIETHSETFILRLRRRIAEGSVDAEQISLVFVDEDPAMRIRQVRLDQLGNPDYWPESVFEEDYEEARALLNAQEEKLSN